MFKKKKEELDYENLNEAILIGKKILKILLVLLILSIIIIAIFLCQQIQIFKIIGNILGVITPFFIGVVIAWLFDPLVTWLTKKKVKRSLATIFVFFLFLFILFLLFRIITPMLYNQINDFVSTLPSLFTTINNFINDIFEKLSSTGIDLSKIEANVYGAIENFSVELTTSLPTTVMNAISGIVSSICTFVLGIMVGFYLLLDFDNITHILDFIPKKYHHTILAISKRLNGAFRDFVQGTLTIALVVSIVSTIGYAIIGLPSPLLFGIICGITNVIPYIGPWIGGAICVIIGFTISPLVGILAAVVAVIVQQLDNVVLQPVIMGKTMKLHPVTIMIGLLVFGYFFGIIGMILATPIMAGIKIILNYFDEKYDLMQKIKQEGTKEG